jgi:H+/Cl- antiporter ClcA
MSEHVPPEGIDLEQLLADALRPIEPPERLGGRVETTLAKLTEAAASELSWWADELSDTELQALRDPRNWVRPVAAAAVGGVAGTALVLIEVRRRRRGDGIRSIVGDIRRATNL